MECPVCGQELKRERQENGQIAMVCTNPDCNYWEPTPELAPPRYDDQEQYYRETLLEQQNHKED